jgi:hypothetical protein
MSIKQLIKNLVRRLIHLTNKGGRLNEILLNELIQSINGNKFHHSVIDRIYFLTKVKLFADIRGRYSPARGIDIFTRINEGLPKDFKFNGISTFEFGCGRENPFSQSALFYLNGAKQTFALDIEAINDPERTKESFIETIFEFRRNIQKCLHHNSSRLVFIEQFNKLDIDGLNNVTINNIGNYFPIQYYVSDLQSVALEFNQFGLVTSRSVLEHLMYDFTKTVELIFNLIEPGGLFFNEVDLRDHRHRSDGFNKWSFMTENNSTYEISNKLRACQIREIFEQVGFEIIYWHPTREPIDSSVWNSIIPEFKKFEREELETTIIEFTSQKPYRS